MPPAPEKKSVDMFFHRYTLIRKLRRSPVLADEVPLDNLIHTASILFALVLQVLKVHDHGNLTVRAQHGFCNCITSVTQAINPTTTSPPPNARGKSIQHLWSSGL